MKTNSYKNTRLGAIASLMMTMAFTIAFIGCSNTNKEEQKSSEA